MGEQVICGAAGAILALLLRWWHQRPPRRVRARLAMPSGKALLTFILWDSSSWAQRNGLRSDELGHALVTLGRAVLDGTVDEHLGARARTPQDSGKEGRHG
jgi:hypothetical protein